VEGDGAAGVRNVAVRRASEHNAPPGRAGPEARCTIAVDLTPLLPGGANGGARRFVFALVRELAAQFPDSRFVLLTQAATHAELASLDAPNVTRHLAVGSAAAGARTGLFAGGSRLLAHLPAAMRRGAAVLGYRLNDAIKRRGALSALHMLRPDLLFCPFTAPSLRLPGTPTVCTLYDQQFRAFPQFFSEEDATLRRRALRDACRHAAAIAAISEHSRREAIELEGADPARIVAIELRLARESSVRPAPDLRFGVRPGRYLLYPANPWPHKNHAGLLEGFAIASRSGLAADVKLVCTGERTPRTAVLAAHAAALGVAERVSFPGYIDEADLSSLTAHCAGVIFPSLYEGFGLPVIDAMAAGVPVACSDAAALPETAGGAALLFDPRDLRAIAGAIATLAGDDDARRALAARGRERAREFMDAPRMAREYGALFARILRERA
jgi:glycosyltransferase involved in cell wall biosynthesis